MLRREERAKIQERVHSAAVRAWRPSQYPSAWPSPSLETPPRPACARRCATRPPACPCWCSPQSTPESANTSTFTSALTHLHQPEQHSSIETEQISRMSHREVLVPAFSNSVGMLLGLESAASRFQDPSGGTVHRSLSYSRRFVSAWKASAPRATAESAEERSWAPQEPTRPAGGRGWAADRSKSQFQPATCRCMRHTQRPPLPSRALASKGGAGRALWRRLMRARRRGAGGRRRGRAR